MRLQPLPPHTLAPDIRFVHDEIVSLIGRSQSQVRMVDEQAALLGPFIPALHYPQFGIPALSFLRTLDTHATLDKKLREIAILTVGGFYRACFELYAHEIMAVAFGIPQNVIAALAIGRHPEGLSEQEAIVHEIAFTIVNGRIVADSTYQTAVSHFGQDRVAELYFLIAGYSMIAVLLNGFDIPTPDNA